MHMDLGRIFSIQITPKSGFDPSTVKTSKPSCSDTYFDTYHEVQKTSPDIVI